MNSILAIVGHNVSLPERTFYRYLSAVFSHDRQLLAEKVSDEEMVNPIAILRDEYIQQSRQLQQMANDKDIHAKIRESMRTTS